MAEITGFVFRTGTTSVWKHGGTNENVFKIFSSIRTGGVQYRSMSESWELCQDGNWWETSTVWTHGRNYGNYSRT